MRRQRYVTHSCPEPGTGDFWDGVLCGRVTRLKSQSAKRMLEEHFTSLVKETEARKERFAGFQQEMASSDLTEEQRNNLLREFRDDETHFLRLTRRKFTSSRYKRIKLIGKGGFGEVWLVQDKENGALYAMKILRKSDIILKDQLLNVRVERDILSQSSNPWVVQLQCSFQDKERLYLVLEYMCGGDLMTALINKDRFSEQETRFFAGEIAMALHAIHEDHFLHRDLKPDNILVGPTGHIKLTDFGLSRNNVKQDRGLSELMDEIHKELMVDQPQTDVPCHIRGDAVGTREYTAPEVLEGRGATTASDYWSLGVIIYEMLFGYPPFHGKSAQETVFRVLRWKRALRFPPNAGVSPVAIDLIKHLLCEAECRFGYEQLIQHPFFVGFKFDNVKMNMPPFVPIIRSPTDTSHFEPLEPTPEEGITGREVGNEELQACAFLGFTYKRRQRHSLRT